MSPGTDSKAAIDLLDERFPAQAGDTISIVIHDDAGVTSPGASRLPNRSSNGFVQMPHILAVTAPWDPAGASQVSGDGTTGYAIVQLDSTSAAFPIDVATEMLDLAADARTAGVQIELAGQAIDNAQSTSIGAEGPGLLVAAIILLIAFGSLVAMGLPLATALFGVGVGLAGGDAADQRPRHPRMGELGGNDDRARRRDRLRAVDRHSLPHRAGPRRQRQRRPSPPRWAPPAAPSCSPASPSSSRCSAC